MDLNAEFDAVREIEKLKASQSVPIIGFFSHVQVDLKRGAEQAGAQEVLPRSVFTERLADILS